MNPVSMGTGRPVPVSGTVTVLGMSAGVAVLLEERDVAVAVQEMGAAQARDAGADDGEFGH